MSTGVSETNDVQSYRDGIDQRVYCDLCVTHGCPESLDASPTFKSAANVM
jgi:hypothetical protein